MLGHTPKHRNKYFEFVEHMKPKRRRGRHAAPLPAPYLVPYVLVVRDAAPAVDSRG